MHGEPIAGRPTHVLAREGMALVPEGRALFFGLTVREHLRLARTKDGVGEKELLAMLPELEKCLDRKAGLLSGGEQQMLAVGRALVSRPRILLVDEMSLGLAPVIVERLLPILRRVPGSGQSRFLSRPPGQEREDGHDRGVGKGRPHRGRARAEDTKYGAVETRAEAARCADLFKHRDRIDGVIVTLPNFGDERAIADTLRMAGLTCRCWCRPRRIRRD